MYMLQHKKMQAYLFCWYNSTGTSSVLLKDLCQLTVLQIPTVANLYSNRL